MTTNKGFTLVESLIAIAIIALAIGGPLYSTSRSLAVARNASNRLIASYLAQEGVEYVRMLRDGAFLARYNASDPTASTDAWNDFLGAYPQCIVTSDQTKACTLDPQSGLSGSSCTIGSTCTPLYLTANGYQQNSGGGGVLQPFTRTVQFFSVSATDERIVSKVTWSFRGTVSNVSVTTHLTPWQ